MSTAELTTEEWSSRNREKSTLLCSVAEPSHAGGLSRIQAVEQCFEVLVVEFVDVFLGLCPESLDIGL